MAFVSRSAVRYAACVGVVSVALALGGCSDSTDDGHSQWPTDTATPSPTFSTSPSGTGTPTASSASPTPATSSTVVLDLPQAAKAHTQAGAQAFAEYYTRAMDRASVEMDASIVSALSAPGCDSCRKFEGLIRQHQAKGERTLTRAFSVNFSNVDYFSARDAEVSVAVAVAPSRIVRTDGSTVTSWGSSRISYRYAIAWNGSGWTVTDWELE